MWCKDIVQENIEWCYDQFAIKERVHRHQRYLRTQDEKESELMQVT